uniref:VWFA domain-containing protein n=1 Tax=Eptatretus burgeri TaxID=7764 RepID=A0A8C4N316_EPTBU
MKAFGVEVFSIGVGEVNYNTLQAIASAPDKKHVTQFIDLSDMQEIITILSDILCPSAVTTEPASPPSPEPVSLPQETSAPVSPPSPEPVSLPQVTTALVSPASPEPATQPEVTASAVKECVAEQKADLVFLLDGSTSVTEDNFMKVLNAVQMIVDSLNIGADKVRVALVQYSGSFFGGKNTLHFNLDQYNNAADLHKAISSVSYMKGFTYTGKALDYTLKNVFEAKARPSVAKVLILITDGNANDIVTIPAKNVKDFGVTVYSIGVGNINLDQLKVRYSFSSSNILL